jgi:hypothetical protein
LFDLEDFLFRVSWASFVPRIKNGPESHNVGNSFQPKVPSRDPSATTVYGPLSFCSQNIGGSRTAIFFSFCDDSGRCPSASFFPTNLAEKAYHIACYIRI